MSGLSALLIFVGLFLLGGAVSFYKQKLPKGVIGVLASASVLALLAGILRLDWWT